MTGDLRLEKEKKWFSILSKKSLSMQKVGNQGSRHWLNSLPAESIGCWEDLDAAFLDNFQGTYVRPPDADDLSHII